MFWVVDFVDFLCAVVALSGPCPGLRIRNALLVTTCGGCRWTAVSASPDKKSSEGDACVFFFFFVFFVLFLPRFFVRVCDSN